MEDKKMKVKNNQLVDYYNKTKMGKWIQYLFGFMVLYCIVVVVGLIGWFLIKFLGLK